MRLLIKPTLGELLVAPIGLAMVSNLAPARYAGLLMGVWLFSIAIGNKMAGLLAGYMESISHATFYLIFVTILWSGATVIFLFSRKLLRLIAR